MVRGVSLILLLFGTFVYIAKGQLTAEKTDDDVKTPKPRNDSCICVPYYLCYSGSINTNGKDLVNILSRMFKEKCPSDLDVCCNRGNIKETPMKPPPVKTSGCGRRHPNGIESRITSHQDEETKFGEFPWMVAVFREESIEGLPDKPKVYHCGGALIHPQMVVTVAHRVSGKTDDIFKIRAGEQSYTNEVSAFQERDVQTIVVHPHYSADTLYNDIALLYLKSPVNIANNVDTVCLPPQGTVIKAATCYATGWGKNADGKSGTYQTSLKKVDLPLVPNNKCQKQLRKTMLGRWFELHESFVCAGGVLGKDTCAGDGGSPLVCPFPGQNERYYQIGIVAWGIGCGENKVPGVYTNLALFRDWIDDEMKAFALDIRDCLLKKNEKLTKEALELSPDEKADNFFNQDLLHVGKISNIHKVHPGLIQLRQVGLWNITRCLNCDFQTHAIHREKGAAYVLIHSKLLNREAINNIKSNDLVSPIFQIIVNPNAIGPDNSILDTYQNRNTVKVIKDINDVITTYIRIEQAAVEERIQKYSDEQYELLNVLKDKAYKEREALVRIIQNAAREDDSVNELSPKSPKGFGNLLSNDKHSASNSPSDASFSPKRPKSIGASKERTIETIDDILFDFETEDRNTFHNRTDDSDSEDIEEAEDVVNESSGVSILQGRSAGSSSSIAKSCPVDIPIFSQPMRSKNGRSEAKEGADDAHRPNEEFDIAASIKALARSVHGDAIFGDLPRPKFSTQI